MRLHAERAGWSPSEIIRATAAEHKALPTIDFVAEAEICPSCSADMEIEKSRRRTVVTLAQGPFEAREIFKRCANGRTCSVAGSRALAEIVKSRQRLGYDLMVYVGLSRYLHGKQRQEIRATLFEERGIELSAASVSRLCDRFLVYIESLHTARAPNLRAAMEGGYPLHLDATCEKGKGGLSVTMDGWRGWVLTAGRIPTEHKDHLQPLVQKAVELFGDPVATVHDLGESVGLACESLRKRGIHDLVCHYHFLSAVGKKLFELLYSRLRKMLRKSRVSHELYVFLRELRCYRKSKSYVGSFRAGTVREEFLALVLWLLEGEGKKDSPFPFALPHRDFVQRCRSTREQGDRWVPLPRSRVEHRAFKHLLGLVDRLKRDPRIFSTVDALEQRWQAFSELRDVLRLTNPELGRGEAEFIQSQPLELELQRLKEIEEQVEQYRNDLGRRVHAEPEKDSPHAIILKYLERYAEHLFGHPAVRDSDGSVIRVVERTNNVLEHFFGKDKQRLRRRLGRANIARDLAEQPAQVALVANLLHPDYVRVLCGSLEALPAAFAALDAQPMTSHPTRLCRDRRDLTLWRKVHFLLQAEATASGKSLSAPVPLPPVAQSQAHQVVTFLEHLPAGFELVSTAGELSLPARVAP